MEHAGFTTIRFPKDEDIVYVLSFSQEPNAVHIPFYVGESRRSTRRIGDYLTAQFAAPTDFKVGTAIKTLEAAGCEVFVHYKPSVNRRHDERVLIERFQKEGYMLLNTEPGYNYRNAERPTEETRIQQFIQRVLQKTASSHDQKLA